MDWEAVARTILDRMTAMEGRFQLVQRAVGDLQERGGPENVDDDAGRDSDDEVAFTGVGHTPPAVPPADAPAPASHALSAIEKMDIAEWRNLSTGKRIIWMLLGERPVNASMTVLEMQVCLRHVANVSKDVAEMVNTLSGFEVQRFVGVGDDAYAALTVADHLQVLVAAVVTFLREQASAAEAHRRVDSLERALNVGLTELRRLYGKFRPKLQPAGNAAVVADKVNLSLNEWAAALFSGAGKLGSRHRKGPPALHEFGAVIIPDWRLLLEWSGGSGVEGLPGPL